MSGEAREGLRSPWLQAGRLAFLALFGVTLLAALENAQASAAR
ncbi:hypothetical protein ACV341_33460, partial [Pseudomonas aeruginosa]